MDEQKQQQGMLRAKDQRRTHKILHKRDNSLYMWLSAGKCQYESGVENKAYKIQYNKKLKGK